MPSRRHQPRTPLWAAVLFAAVLLTLFWPVLLAGHRLAFRDVSHFYLPLYEYLAGRITAGDFPLWNPLDQTGVPIAGEATTALFYPGTVLFWLGLPTAYAMALYVLLHLSIAAAGAWRLARVIGIRPAAATLALLGYTFSTPVVFLYCNPPFLVGAAWLPWHVVGLWQVLRNPSLHKAALAAAPAALSILGGDPQTVAHAWVLATAALLLAPLCRSLTVAARGPRAGFATLFKTTRGPSIATASRARGAPAKAHNVTACSKRTTCALPHQAHRFVPLAAVAALALAASTIQVWPAAAWAQHSWRAASSPPTVYAPVAIAGDGDPSASSWWRRPPHGTHAASIYRFSVAPWHYVTLLVPNLYGNLFPINTRWSRGIAGEPAMWTPSCYCGIVIAIGAIAGFTRVRFRSSRTHKAARFCRFASVFSMLAALGEFGLIRALQTAMDSDLGGANGALGGLYWVLVTCVPFYASFRYPAKWLVPLALALSTLAAAVFDSPTARRQLTCVAGLLITLLAVTGGIAVSPAGGDALLSRIAAAPADYFWGPVDRAAALSGVAVAVLTALGMSLLVLLIARRDRWRAPMQNALLGGVLACDLALANIHLIATVPVEQPGEKPFVASADRVDVQRHATGSQRILTAYDSDDWPERWKETPSPRRIERVERSQQLALFGRWHLPAGIGQIDSVPSLIPARNRLFMHAARSSPESTDRWPCDADVWQRYRAISGTAARVTLAPPIPAPGPPQLDSALPNVVVDSCEPEPDAYLYVQWRDVPPLAASQLQHSVERLLSATGEAPVGFPLVERAFAGDVRHEPPHPPEPFRPAPPQRIAARRDGSEAEEFEIATPSTALLYRPAFQDGYWTARIRRDSASQWQRLDVHPANIIGQSVVLPAGNWRVRFEYRPTWLIPATAITLVAWLLIGSAALRRPPAVHRF